MLQQVIGLIEGLGLSTPVATALAHAIGLLALLLVAWIVYLISKREILHLAETLFQKTETHWDDQLIKHRVLFWLSHLAPGIVIYTLAPLALEGADRIISILQGGARIYMVVVSLFAVDAFFNACLAIYKTFAISRQVPLKSFVQVAKIILYLIAIIIIFASLLGRSPFYLLSGMGVLASVLMLVFKDPILGFVGGIQLSTNRMLARGDWIEMPSHNADGDVIEIALTTVKVQNWDKTITTIPTYDLLTNSFKNWRGMSESGGRRIKRPLYVDMNTIQLCTPEMIERFSRIQYISEYIRNKQAELDSWNRERHVDDSVPVNGRRLTNVGTFRAYIRAYLRNHPKIHQEMTMLVRHLDPTAQGLPIEIYCFSNDQAWSNYEDIQADIFDHLLAVAPQFDLRVFQEQSDLHVLSPRQPSASAVQYSHLEVE